MPCPAALTYWRVDEAAECLPGMLGTGAYEALWALVPEDDNEPSPGLAEVWEKLSPRHRQLLITGYRQEYGNLPFDL